MFRLSVNRKIYFFLSKQANLFLSLLYCTSLVHDCRDKPFSLSSLSVMVAVEFLYLPFILLRKFPTTIKKKVIANKPTKEVEVEA